MTTYLQRLQAEAAERRIRALAPDEWPCLADLELVAAHHPVLAECQDAQHLIDTRQYAEAQEQKS